MLAENERGDEESSKNNSYCSRICLFTVVERYYASRGAKLLLCQN